MILESLHHPGLPLHHSFSLALFEPQVKDAVIQ